MKLSEKQKNILRFLGKYVLSFAVNVLLKSVRINYRNKDELNKLIADKKNFIAAFWHGTMVTGWFVHKNMNCAALVSKSKDGDVLANILSKWKFNVVRGSSHIGGKEALELMCSLLQQKYSLTITPDGPTGPIHKMKAGAVVAAKRSNVPLFLVGVGIKRKFVLKSWDKFEIPKPFAKVNVFYSDPVYIKNDLGYDETSLVIEDCEVILNQLQKEAQEN